MASSLQEALGAAAVVDAAGIIAAFNGLNRVADATGTRLEEEISLSGI